MGSGCRCLRVGRLIQEQVCANYLWFIILLMLYSYHRGSCSGIAACACGGGRRNQCLASPVSRITTPQYLTCQLPAQYAKPWVRVGCFVGFQASLGSYRAELIQKTVD